MIDEERIAGRTGIAVETVTRILAAQLDFLLALGLASPDDEGRGAVLRHKYPDLLRPSVVERQGRSPETPVEYALEATIVQLESDSTAADVVEVLAAYHELNGLVSAALASDYRRWARSWVKR